MTSSYKVRLYKESDHDSVQKIFISGCREHIPTVFYNALRQPHIWLLLLTGLLLPLVTNGSILLSILGGCSVLVMIWYPGRDFFLFHARHGLVGDLKDIRKYYLEREGHCFWVVELEGEVVGMVAAIPFHASDEKIVELKRMFVASPHRGKGIAKLLCRTLIDYARKSGCNAVVLSTTTVQVNARRLYEKMGFKPTDTTEHNTLPMRLVRLTWVSYRYNISYNR
ncbi:N-acetyltransferase 8B-like isoform X2 [Rhinoderma darwinii]